MQKKLSYKYTLIAILTSLLVVACTQPADEPKAIADRYWTLLQTGKNAEAEKLISTNSRRFISGHSEQVTSTTQITNDGNRAIVSTSITKIDTGTQQPYTESFDTILVLEQGKWKIDAEQTLLPTPPVSKQEELEKLAEDLSESMQENMDSIDQAMDQGMQMLDEALEEGSKEMSQSLLELMNELNSTMKQSIDKMKQRRQHQPDEQDQNRQDDPQQKPDPRKGEGMI